MLAPAILVHRARYGTRRRAFLSALRALSGRPLHDPFILQLWLFVSGVVYAIDSLPTRWQWVFALNPMTAVISGFQWGLLGAVLRPRARRSSVLAPTASSSSSGSGTSGAPSRASRTRSDGDCHQGSRVSQRATASASIERAYGTLRDSLAGCARRAFGVTQHADYEDIWALRDVSFDVPRARSSASSGTTAPASRRSSS